MTGSRDWPEEDWRVISDTLWEINPLTGREHYLIHGGAGGVDTIANNVIATWGWQAHCVTAQWAEHGKAAGPMRNQRMVDMNPDVCVVFRRDKSRGATDCGNRAEKAGIKTYWIEYEDIDS